MVNLDFILIFSGLFIGIAFGFVLSKNKICTNSAFINVFLFRGSNLVKILLLSVIISMIGVASLSLLSLVQYAPMSFSYLLDPIGGIIFGIGMVLASGCASGICYKAAQGTYQALVAIIGFALGGLLTQQFYFVGEIRAATTFKSISKPTLNLFFGIPNEDIAIFGLIVGLASLLFFIFANIRTTKTFTNHTIRKFGRSFTEKIKGTWPWWITGSVLGIIGISAIVIKQRVTNPASSSCGCESPGLTISDGIINFFAFGWGSFLVIGTILGSLIAALWLHEFKFEVHSTKKILTGLIGGIFMGSGAVMTGGCNIGHIFGGIPELSLGSFVTIIFMVVGNWSTVFVLNHWFGSSHTDFSEISEYSVEPHKKEQSKNESSIEQTISSTQNDFLEPIVVDTRGEVCPIPLMLTRRAFRKNSQEQEFIIIGDHRQSLTDIPEYVKKIHSQIVDIKEDTDGTWYIIIKYIPSSIF